MSNVLSNLSEELASLVKATDENIVRIEARRRLPATGVVWSEDGLIVTAHHVVERDEDITIGLSNGETATATLVGRDPSTDIAVLRVSDAELKPAQWGDAEDLNVGNLVLALGRPRDSVLASLGVVSMLEKDWRPRWRRGHGGGRRGGWRGRRGHGRKGKREGKRGGAKLEYFLQTDVVMYPGFSGGPLVGADNKIYGINTSALMHGISMTLTTPTLERVINTLSTHGKMKRGYLGVGVQTVELPKGIAEELEQEQGLLAISIEPDSPAEKSGLVLGDTLLSLDEDPVQDIEELLSLLSGDRIGEALPLQILRAGELKELSITVGERE